MHYVKWSWICTFWCSPFIFIWDAAVWATNLIGCSNCRRRSCRRCWRAKFTGNGHRRHRGTIFKGDRRLVDTCNIGGHLWNGGGLASSVSRCLWSGGLDNRSALQLHHRFCWDCRRLRSWCFFVERRVDFGANWHCRCLGFERWRSAHGHLVPGQRRRRERDARLGLIHLQFRVNLQQTARGTFTAKFKSVFNVKVFNGGWSIKLAVMSKVQSYSEKIMPTLVNCATVRGCSLTMTFGESVGATVEGWVLPGMEQEEEMVRGMLKSPGAGWGGLEGRPLDSGLGMKRSRGGADSLVCEWISSNILVFSATEGPIETSQDLMELRFMASMVTSIFLLVLGEFWTAGVLWSYLIWAGVNWNANLSGLTAVIVLKLCCFSIALEKIW